MDPINSANPILDALRRQVLENVERLRRAGKLAASGRPADAAPPDFAAETLEVTLRRRVGATDRHTSKGLEAATCVFVEAALVDAFGPQLLTDPQFAIMVKDIAHQLRDDLDLRAGLDAILTSL